MGNVKKQLQDYYDRVVQLDGLEHQIDIADDVSQIQRFINYKLKPKFQSETELCNDIAVERWNEHWSKYNVPLR